MADFYTGLRNTADKLLSDKGQVVRVKRALSSFDPITGETVDGSVVFQDLNAAIFDTKSGTYDQSITQEKIVGETKSALVSTNNSTFTPEVLDEVIIGQEIWKIFGFSKLTPSTVDVIFKLGIMLVGSFEAQITYYIRPDGFKYLRPDGISFYTRPII